MTAGRRRRDPHTRTVVRLPERDLAESILHLAAPLFEPLGASPTIEERRRALDLAIRLWNAHVAASKLWGDPRPKALTELRKEMRNTADTSETSSTFELLSNRWREHFVFDPRLVGTWTYEPGEEGQPPRLVCEMDLPRHVEAEVPPPAEKRIAIAGKFLDEVRIRQSATAYVGFPVESSRAVIDTGGRATVYTKMPVALQLFAEGRLSRLGGDPVEVSIGGKELGPMVLAEVRCGGEICRDDIAVLVFEPSRPASAQ